MMVDISIQSSAAATGESPDPQELPCAVTKHGIPIRNIWHMLLYAWNCYEKLGRFNAEIISAASLDSLLALILVSLVQQRLRIGLGRDYTPTCGEIAGIRGRIDFQRSLKAFSFQRGKAVCHFDTFSANVPKNQIIRSTLAMVAKVGQFGPDKKSAEELRSKVRRAVWDLEGVELIPVAAEQIQRQRAKRLDADYSLMLAVCHLLHQRLTPTELAGSVPLPGFDRDEKTLHQIFERFVATFYQVHLAKQWRVRPQKSISWNSDRLCAHLPAMYLDIQLEHRETKKLVIIDTKFTANILRQGRWHKSVFDRSHLFQMYSYLRSQENVSPAHLVSTGLLLYPACKVKVSESVRLQGHVIGWETIDLAQGWREVESDLLTIVHSGAGV